MQTETHPTEAATPALHSVRYSVTVGNIGQVHIGNDYWDALGCYEYYVRDSRDGGIYSRAYGEQVVLWRDDEPIEIYEPEKVIN